MRKWFADHEAVKKAREQMTPEQRKFAEVEQSLVQQHDVWKRKSLVVVGGVTFRTTPPRPTRLAGEVRPQTVRPPTPQTEVQSTESQIEVRPQTTLHVKPGTSQPQAGVTVPEVLPPKV